MQYSWYGTGNRNSFLVCRMSEGKWMSFMKFHVFGIQKLVSCLLLTGFLSFFFSLFTVNSVSRIGCIEKETSPKTCFFKDIFGISSVYECDCSIQQTFPCNCRNEKILAKGKWKIAAPVEKNLRKWFLRRKWANEEKGGDEYVKVLWKRGSAYGGDRFGVEDCMDCRISSCLPFIFLPPHSTSPTQQAFWLTCFVS